MRSPPPPPPDVPELEEDHDDASPKSLRERLELHRANPTCATCHDRLDPMGFSLENYDVLGRWREEEASGHPIDASASLPDGTTFTGPHELKSLLLERKDQIMRQFAKKMLGYALARGLTYEDYCTVDRLVDDDEGFSARPGAVLPLPASLEATWSARAEELLAARPEPSAQAMSSCPSKCSTP